MSQRIKDILKLGDVEFGNKEQIDTLHQEIALNFYPERADFTDKRNEGEEFATDLFTSHPVMARRELGNIVSLFLYSRAQKRFSIHVDDKQLDESLEERRFLEFMTDIQWRAMYDSSARFARATKQTGHDFVTFGNGVIRFGPNLAGDGLLFRNYHLRDCAWSENAEGKIDVLHRKWNPTARQLKQLFGDKISETVGKAAGTEPEKTFLCRHVVLPSRIMPFTSKFGREFPFVSLIIEKETGNVLEEIGLNYFPYVVPRWQTVSGSKYGVSMATAVMLPDGRTMQAVVRTLREAGEKYVDPPMLAVSDVIRGDMALYAGGVTTVDEEYDERLGEALRPVTQNRGGMPIGVEIANALREDLSSGFFLDKIQLPITNSDMTAFEVRRRIEEHIRAQAPIFDPIEEEFTPLYEGVFQLLRDGGAFPIDDMPDSLLGRDIQFKFRSPLADLADQAEAETYVDVLNRILLPTAEIDPAQIAQANLDTSTRDAMRAAGWKADWFGEEDAVDEERARLAEQAEAQETMQALQQVAEVGKAAQELDEGGA
jgi:hypothetical protein